MWLGELQTLETQYDKYKLQRQQIQAGGSPMSKKMKLVKKK
jgi:hypothetical protein